MLKPVNTPTTSRGVGLGQEGQTARGAGRCEPEQPGECCPDAFLLESKVTLVLTQCVLNYGDWELQPALRGSAEDFGSLCWSWTVNFGFVCVEVGGNYLRKGCWRLIFI